MICVGHREDNKMKKRIKYILLSLLLIQVGCYAPEQSYPTIMPTPIIAQIPELLKRGEEYTFTIHTSPDTLCHAGIGYYNNQDKWTKEDLPTIKSDEFGNCRWIWALPTNVKEGIGEFRGYIEQNGEERNIYPATFCVEVCQ
jgi:hypothetical protein